MQRIICIVANFSRKNIGRDDDEGKRRNTRAKCSLPLMTLPHSPARSILVHRAKAIELDSLFFFTLIELIPWVLNANG